MSTGSTDASSIDVDVIPPKFLALCVNTGGMYKTLAELDMSRINSDGEAFSQMKKAYLQYRGVRSRLHFLVKPVTVEFVRVSLEVLLDCLSKSIYGDIILFEAF